MVTSSSHRESFRRTMIESEEPPQASQHPLRKAKDDPSTTANWEILPMMIIAGVLLAQISDWWSALRWVALNLPFGFGR